VFSGVRVVKIALAIGALSQTPLGSLQLSPEPLTGQGGGKAKEERTREEGKESSVWKEVGRVKE